MTSKEALKELKQYFKIYMTQPFPEFANMAIEALEKQTPKKLGENFACPSCGEIVGDGLYCEWCGQALDLSEDKE